MRQDRIFIPLTVPKTVLDKYDGPYFYHQGVALEETVRNHEVENCVEAIFEGFDVMSPFEQDAFLQQKPHEETITAKLYYTVLIEDRR